MSHANLLLETDSRGVATLTMNRPEVHNAFDDAFIADMTQILTELADNDAVRVVLLAASGKSFSAGADLNWMRRMAEYSHDENIDDAMALARLMNTLDTMPKPTVAVVQGAAFGGGVGLVACCDMAVAAREAVFCLSEVRLGLIPAAISPYVIAAIGARAARRYFLTAERFDANSALRLGLIHEVVGATDLTATAERLVGHLLNNGSNALGAAKDLIKAVSHKSIDEQMSRHTAERIAERRASPEGREGVAAFLEKRQPDWTTK